MGGGCGQRKRNPFQLSVTSFRLSASSAPRIDRKDAIALDLDFARVTEKLEQNGDPLPGRHYPGHERAEPSALHARKPEPMISIGCVPMEMEIGHGRPAS